MYHRRSRDADNDDFGDLPFHRQLGPTPIIPVPSGPAPIPQFIVVPQKASAPAPTSTVAPSTATDTSGGGHSGVTPGTLVPGVRSSSVEASDSPAPSISPQTKKMLVIGGIVLGTLGLMYFLRKKSS